MTQKILRLYLKDKTLFVSDWAHLIKKSSIIAVSNTDDTEPGLNFILHQVTLKHFSLLNSSWATTISSICQEENEKLLAILFLNNLLSNVLDWPTKISSSSSLNSLNLILEDWKAICLKDLIITLKRHGNQVRFAPLARSDVEIFLSNFETLFFDDLNRASAHWATLIDADDELLVSRSLNLILLELVLV